MRNLTENLSAELQKETKKFGLKEVFLIDGELYTTSNYVLTESLLEQIEKEVKSKDFLIYRTN